MSTMTPSEKKFYAAVRLAMAERSGDSDWLLVSLDRVPGGNSDSDTIEQVCEIIEAECFEPKHLGVSETEGAAACEESVSSGL